MLHALSSTPCELATIHAINSQLVLHDCLASDDFIALVRLGRVRFRVLPGASSVPPEQRGPRVELSRRFAVDRYLYVAWPELSETGASRKHNVDYARKAAEYLFNPVGLPTKCPALDERLHRANQFFSALEHAQSLNYAVEQPRQQQFESLALKAPESIEADHPEAAARLRSVLRGDNRSRAAIYERIDVKSEDKAVNGANRVDGWAKYAKAAIDMAYDSAVAHSLESRLLSCPKAATIGPQLQQSRAPVQVEVNVRQLTDQQLRELRGLDVQWKHVRAALGDGDLRDGDQEEAFVRLSTLLSNSHLEKSVPRVLKVGGDALGALGAVASWVISKEAGYFVEVPGSLAASITLSPVVAAASSWIAGSKTFASAMESINERVTEWRRPRTTAKLIRMRGWLDLV
jgi:hypothetical protein